jgi:hypothetical protein
LVEHAKDRSVDPDSDRHGQHGYQGESGILPQGAQRKPDVIHGKCPIHAMCHFRALKTRKQFSQAVRKWDRAARNRTAGSLSRRRVADPGHFPPRARPEFSVDYG